MEAGVTVRVAPTPAEALGLLPLGLSVVCGSLYLVGEVRPLLLGQVARRAGAVAITGRRRALACVSLVVMTSLTTSHHIQRHG